jgi:hypothetical protein
VPEADHRSYSLFNRQAPFMFESRRINKSITGRPLSAAILVAGFLVSAGCAQEHVKFTEFKRADEKITQAELKQLLKIVNSLPEKRLPDLSSAYARPPEWIESRTLSVGELVVEEEKRLENRTSVEWIARELQGKRSLQRTLKRHDVTGEQFVGLTLAIGVALSKTTLRENQDLDRTIQRGQKEIETLRADERPFSELRPEEMHSILQRAVWITRLDRAKRLKLVPPENIALVQQHRKALEAIFPRDFLANPLDAVADRLDEQGLPFEELPETGSDEGMKWDAQTAIRGTDPPDPEPLPAASAGFSAKR